MLRDTEVTLSDSVLQMDLPAILSTILIVLVIMWLKCLFFLNSRESGSSCSWFQGCISPLDQWEGCQCFALGPDSSWVLESLLCGGLLSGCSPQPAQLLGPWTSGYWLRSWGHTAEGYQGRPLGSLSFDLCWALLLQLPRRRHLQSGCHAVEALTSWCSTLIVCLLASALSMLFTSQWGGNEG